MYGSFIAACQLPVFMIGVSQMSSVLHGPRMSPNLLVCRCHCNPSPDFLVAPVADVCQLLVVVTSAVACVVVSDLYACSYFLMLVHRLSARLFCGTCCCVEVLLIVHSVLPVSFAIAFSSCSFASLSVASTCTVAIYFVAFSFVGGSNVRWCCSFIHGSSFLRSNLRLVVWLASR